MIGTPKPGSARWLVLAALVAAPGSTVDELAEYLHPSEVLPPFPAFDPADHFLALVNRTLCRLALDYRDGPVRAARISEVARHLGRLTEAGLVEPANQPRLADWWLQKNGGDVEAGLCRSGFSAAWTGEENEGEEEDDEEPEEEDGDLEEGEEGPAPVEPTWDPVAAFGDPLPAVQLRPPIPADSGPRAHPAFLRIAEAVKACPPSALAAVGGRWDGHKRRVWRELVDRGIVVGVGRRHTTPAGIALIQGVKGE